MSAYILNPSSIAALACVYANGTGAHRASTAHELARTNVRAVARRYGLTPNSACRAFLNMPYNRYVDTCRRLTDTEFEFLRHRIDTTQSDASSYAYNAGGHPAYASSKAAMIIHWIINR